MIPCVYAHVHLYNDPLVDGICLLVDICCNRSQCWMEPQRSATHHHGTIPCSQSHVVCAAGKKQRLSVSAIALIIGAWILHLY